MFSLFVFWASVLYSFCLVSLFFLDVLFLASVFVFSASQVLGSSAAKQALGGILYDAYR